MIGGFRRLLTASAVVLLLAGRAGVSAEAAKKESMGYGHCATLSPLPKAPVLDGKMESGEWDNATSTVNFMQLGGSGKEHVMDSRTGRTWCGFFGDRLYIAMVSELPPRGVAPGQFSYAMTRDAELIGDPNAVEIWLDPNRDRRESGEGDQSFYQIFINTLGSLYDARIIPGKGPDKGWNADIQSGHSLDAEKKLWTFECSIPFKDLGLDGATITGKSMGVLIARNYKMPWMQATWFPHGNAFIEWFWYPRIYMTNDEPVISIESLGDKLFNAQPEFLVKIRNPGAARQAKVNLHVKSSDMPDIKDEKEVKLPEHGVAEYTFKVSEGALHQGSLAQPVDHQFTLHVTNTDNTKTWFDYRGRWSHDPMLQIGWNIGRRPIERKWDIRMEAAPDQSVGFGVYPSYNKIQCWVNAAMLVADPDGKDKDNLSDQATLTISCNGQELAKKELRWDLSKKVYSASNMFELAALPEGEYIISTKFNRHPTEIVKKYTRTKFPFEGSTVGISDEVYPPFEPVKANGSKTSVVCREYDSGGLGLWRSIQSLNKELLAGPIVLKADHARVLDGAGKFTSTKPSAAVYEGEAKDEAVTVRSKCTTEVDGCMKVELELAPGAKQSELKHLALEIPLKDEEAPLWHACTTALRVNPVGAAPAGEGVVWDSTKFPDGDWLGNFKCYLWLGGAERGLCWFADNDKGWVLNYDDKKVFAPCQELIRKNGVLTLRINLVQKPLVIKESRSIVFGLMASPGKPMRADWRAATMGVKMGKNPAEITFMGCNYWGSEETFCSAYPRNHDLTILDAMSGDPESEGGKEIKQKGFDQFFKDWEARNFKPDMPVHGKPRAQIVGLARQSINVARGQSKYFSAYWDEYHADAWFHPERIVYSGEWNNNNMARSRLDFRCYWGAEFVKRNIGLYFDNAYPHQSKDTITSNAYNIPGLGVQGSANLWAQRDYHRRIWTIHRQFGAKWKDRPMAIVHMTNTNVIPYLTWSDATLDLEWFFGPEPQQSKYGYQMLLAQSSGRHTGCYPLALARIESTKTAAESRMATRSRFGAMATHEIKVEQYMGAEGGMWGTLYNFGYGTPECQVYNYWDSAAPVKADNTEVKWLLLKKEKEAILVLCSWLKDPATATMTIDVKALGFTPAAAEDMENQRASLERRLEQLKNIVPQKQAALEQAKKNLAENKPDAANGLKRAQAEADQMQGELRSAEALLPVVEAADKPITFDAGNGKLVIPLEGYGVRLVKLK